jgi:hypothetical protein
VKQEMPNKSKMKIKLMRLYERHVVSWIVDVKKDLNICFGELNSSKLLFMCSWITKCSKSSSYVFISWDHILSSSEGALNHHIHHSQKFWSILGGGVGVSFQLSKSL